MSISSVFADAERAYEALGVKAGALADARAAEAAAVSAKASELDAVKTEHAGYVATAQADADAAKAELTRLQEALHDFLGRPDPRVSVK